MGFFDSVLEEAPKTGTTDSSATKKDDQDGSFLIVDDSIGVNSIPDTAVQLFDATPVATEITPVQEISFFSEPVLTTAESSEIVPETSSSDVAFFDGPMTTSTTETTVTTTETPVVSDTAVSFTEEPVAQITEEVIAPIVVEKVPEAVQQDIIEQETPLFAAVLTETVKEPVINTVSVPEKNDIYTPLRKAITEYDAILATHQQIAEAKDTEISDYNNQVAVAKAAAKQALEERKALESEMDKVRQMKELFSLQLAK